MTLLRAMLAHWIGQATSSCGPEQIPRAKRVRRVTPICVAKFEMELVA
jgi:hypothetical protein